MDDRGGGVTFLAGPRFGYGQGVISGALPLLEVELDLSTLEGGPGDAVPG